MSVVINEFEVVPEQTAPASCTQAAGVPAPQQPPSAPEIERVIVHLAERAERVWAH